MIRLTRSQLQPIGLDLGHDSIKMLQIEVVGENLSVYAAAREAMPAEAQAQPAQRLALAADPIRRMLRQGRFRGRRAVAAMPREIVHVKNFRLPLMPASELETAVLFEARQLFPFDIEGAQLQYLAAGEVRQGNDVLQEVIALAARNQDISSFIEQVHRYGLVLDSLDVEPCALFRSVERFIRRREDEQQVHVLVDIGRNSSQVVIGRGRDISFIKSIEIGGNHMHEAVSRRLGISTIEAQALRRRLIEACEPQESPEKRDPVRQAVIDATRSIMEQLGREIALCLRYQSVTFRGQRPTQLRLLGGEAADPQIRVVLGNILTIPIEAGRPLQSVDTSAMRSIDRRGAMAEWGVALGLALRRTAGRFAPSQSRAQGAGAEPEMAQTENAYATQGEAIDAEPANGAAEPQLAAAASASGASGPSAPAAQEASHA